MFNQDYYRKYTKPTIFVLLVLLILGGFAYWKMDTLLFPDFVFPKIRIIADNGEQPIDKMLITVTRPLEIAIKRVNGIATVRSSTNRGSCTIEAYFEWKTDINVARMQLESRINEIKNILPPTTNLVIEAMSQNIYPVIGYTLESDKYGQIELKNMAMFFARPRFSEVQGISNVFVRGGKTKEFVIRPNPMKLVQLAVNPQNLIDVLCKTNFIESNGLLSDYRRLYLSVTDSRINTLEDLKNLVIRNDGNRIIRLGDLAVVEFQEQQEFIRINANGREAVILDIVKQKGSNLLDFVKNVQEKAREIQQQLPQGMVLKTYYNQSVFVTDSINSVLRAIYEGLILALLVVILFLRSFRASLNVIIIIPVTLALTLTVLYLSGITLNIMSLGAIAASIGLIIDDAIVVIEQIHRVHEENPEKDQQSVVRDTIRMLFPAMVGSSLSTIVIFFPFVMMSGVAGSFFKELTATMEITLVCSFFTTWLGLPALHLALGYRHRNKSTARESENLSGKNSLSWLIWFFDKPAFAIGFIVILAAGAVFLIPRLNTGFLPILDEGTIVFDYLTPPGTALDASDAMMRRVDTVILHHKDVATYMRRTGTNMSSSISMASGVIPPNEGDYLIQLKPGITRKTEDVISELRQKVSVQEPALTIEFGQRIADLLGDLIGRPEPIEIKIFGDDRSVLENLAVRTQGLLSKVKGIADLKNGIVVEGPSISIIPDEARLAQFHLSAADLQTQLQAHNEGVIVGEVQNGEQMLKILLRFTDFRENYLDRILDQPIFSPDGSFRPLEYFARAELSKGFPDVTREDLKSNIVVTARLENRDLGSAMNEIKSNLAGNLIMPPGYYIEYGGTYAQQQSSFKELLMILLTAIVLVFSVLLFLFRDLRIPLLIIFISVLGTAGCVLALYITGIQLNVGSYTGIIMIVGIIAENAIFTVNQFMATMKSTSGDVDASIRYAISLRIRPKLMTAIGAILALTPLALGIGVGAQMQQPLAIAVIGGFIVAMPLLLFVFPSLIRWFYFRPGKVGTVKD
ncbi:MAG: efflux RND transporter permease subunit [Bacteroidetes bacterium]|nr:efflux RND transporter permease subunit [Bacteroidota bacterium]